MKTLVERVNLDVSVEKNESGQFEKCIVCGRPLDVPKDMHIDFRDFYIEGIGQLCYDCYAELCDD